MPNSVDELKSAIATGIEERGLVNSNLPTITAGLESITPVNAELVQQDEANVRDTIENAIATVSLEDSSLKLTPGQIAVGIETAKLALDLNKAQAASRNLIPIVEDDNVTVVEANYGVEDNIDINSIGIEAWDGQDVSNVASYQIVTNILAAKQSPIGEMLFPTVAIPVRQMGFSLSINVDSFYKPIKRSKTGSVDKIEKIPLIKATNDFSNFLVDRTKLVPVLREGTNDNLLLKEQQYVDTDTGEKITTAPIKIDTELSLLGISQTDELIAKGVMDETDALDGAVELKKVYFELNDANNTEMFYFNIRDGYWTSTKRGHNKDLELDFDSSNLLINTSSTKKADGTASSVLGNLPAGYAVKVRVKLSGSGNTETSTIGVYNNKINPDNILVEVRNANGDVIPDTVDDYNTINDVIKTLNVKGYVLEAYSINTNQRKDGQLFTRDVYTTVYRVPFRSPSTLQLPYNNVTGTDNSTDLILSQVAMLGVRTSFYAITALIDYAQILRERRVTGIDYTPNEDLGIGGYSVNVYYNNPTIDLKAVVDGIKSKDRMEDIKATIRNLIWDELSNMVMESNFKSAISLQNGGMVGKIDVKLVVPTRLEKFLRGIDFGDEYNVQIAIPQYQAENTALGDRIFMTLSYGKNTGFAQNPLSFGNMVWSPSYSVDLVKTVEGKTYRHKQIVPRFKHFIHLPILAEFNVINLTDVLGKVTQNMHNQ